MKEERRKMKKIILSFLKGALPFAMLEIALYLVIGMLCSILFQWIL